MSGSKCKHCGSTDIETDPARGDAVCTQCGLVLEDQLIVSETAFEETPSGNMMVLGQFVASDSTGGATGFGASYHVNGKESRQITIQNARKGITHLCQQLRLNKHCIDTSVNFYKMALAKHLTRGRKQAHNHAACVYITCRTEGTAHLLIDISDVLQIDVHELGRTYLRFTKALCINIPSMDPCLYIMRYASKLDFGKKTHEVSMTALRLVQRMKRDSIHSGRRPSGLCGAALLIAGRLHEFNRTPGDIIKIVQVHVSTLKKRLIEFGDTPSSSLTLDEFMTVDLEEEQDPPAFKAARKKDRERLQRLENIDNDFDELQNEINKQLEANTVPKGKRKRKASEINEEVDSHRFIEETTLEVIQTCFNSRVDSDELLSQKDATGLGPNIATMGLISSFDEIHSPKEKPMNPFNSDNGEIDMADLDDNELDEYILTDKEANSKTNLWNEVNATYLEQVKEKEEKRLKDMQEGKPEKKKRKTGAKKKNQGLASSAGEAIEKMLQEKRISSKINYEVLKSLNVGISKDSHEKLDENTSTSNIVQYNVENETKRDNTSKSLLLPLGKEIKIESKLSPKKKNDNNQIPEDLNINNKNDYYTDAADEEEDCVDEDLEVNPDESSVEQLLGQRVEDYGYEYDYGY